MLPLADTIRSRSFPIINWTLIAANLLVFFYELSLSPADLEVFFSRFALVPALLDPARPLSYLTFITHQFLHGGWVHIISNLWILYIFGDNIEDRLGPGRYLLFYLTGGVVAALLQITLIGEPDIPMLGASGAISAVLDAYMLLFPTSRVLTLVPFFYFLQMVRIPAVIYIGMWFVSQLFSGVFALAPGAAMGGVAWWAHIGGFLFGFAAVRLFARRRPAPRWWQDEYFPF